MDCMYLRLKRNYSIMNENDEIHLMNGRCPNYALTWDLESQLHYWEKDHDYFMGNRENITDKTSELREILSHRLQQQTSTKYIVYCELDGILMNKNIAAANNNNNNKNHTTISWMPNGKEFWSKLKKWNPIIITSAPERNMQSITHQTREWCKRELGEDVQVIICPLRKKANYCLYSSILIDARISNSHSWTYKGGKFILYGEECRDDIIDQVETIMASDLLSP